MARGWSFTTWGGLCLHWLGCILLGVDSRCVSRIPKAKLIEAKCGIRRVVYIRAEWVGCS